MRSPKVMGEREIREFLLHLIEERMASRAPIRQARAALTFLYTRTLDRPAEVCWIPVPRLRRPLRVVLSGTEVSSRGGGAGTPRESHRHALASAT